jgi:hypothetical protein
MPTPLRELQISRKTHNTIVIALRSLRLHSHSNEPQTQENKAYQNNNGLQQ